MNRKKIGRRSERRPENRPQNLAQFFGAEIITELELQQATSFDHEIRPKQMIGPNGERWNVICLPSGKRMFEDDVSLCLACDLFSAGHFGSVEEARAALPGTHQYAELSDLALEAMANERFERLTAEQNGQYPTLEDVQTLLPRAVLLPIPAKDKGVYFEGWTKTTFEATQAEDYQTELRSHANTGVLLGRPSANLCAVDCDGDIMLELILALNPKLRETLQTRGQFGAQLWLYIRGDYPQQRHAFAVPLDHPLAADVPPSKDPKAEEVVILEWRADGGQSVIRGIHPEGMRYCALRWVEPITLDFAELRWPSDFDLPWRERPSSQRPRQQTEENGGDLLKRAIERLSIDQLWAHFGYPERHRNPVRSPFHPDDREKSFSVFKDGRCFKDHDPAYEAHKGDSFDFYKLASGQSGNEAFESFVVLTGLTDELAKEKERKQTQASEQKEKKAETFNEYAHVQEFFSTAPPLRCVADKWYVYKQGTWNPTTRHEFRQLAQYTMKAAIRTARRESGILSHVEGWSQIEESQLCGVYRFEGADILANAANGVIRLNKDGYRLEEHSPDFGFTQRLAVGFDPSANCPLFRKTLRAALPNPTDRRLLKLCAGNLLVPDCRFEVCLCCYGAGGNMKSTIAEAIHLGIRTNIESGN